MNRIRDRAPIHRGGKGGEPFVLTVPGFNSSGPDHWQSIWERRRIDCARAELGMWENPRRNAWVTNLNQAIRATPKPVILCAHGLACLAVAWWVILERQTERFPVAGAMLVAPSDCQRDDACSAFASFAPAPCRILPFPSVVVASRNDPAAAIDRSRSLARHWGSDFVDIGNAGHINAEAGLGHWPTGESILEALIDRSAARSRDGVHGFAVTPAHKPAESWAERYA